MIGQQISLRFLIPRAIDVLRTNPLAEGNYYPGDLLNAVLGADKAYWHVNVEQWQMVDEMASSLVSAVENVRDALSTFRSSTFS
jgi:CDI immunity proteins